MKRILIAVTSVLVAASLVAPVSEAWSDVQYDHGPASTVASQQLMYPAIACNGPGSLVALPPGWLLAQLQLPSVGGQQTAREVTGPANEATGFCSQLRMLDNVGQRHFELQEVSSW